MCTCLKWKFELTATRVLVKSVQHAVIEIGFWWLIPILLTVYFEPSNLDNPTEIRLRPSTFNALYRSLCAWLSFPGNERSSLNSNILQTSGRVLRTNGCVPVHCTWYRYLNFELGFVNGSFYLSSNVVNYWNSNFMFPVE